MTGLKSYADPDRIYDDADAREARQVAEWLAPDACRTFYPGEPIAAPKGRRPDASMTRALVVILLISGVGWALFRTEAEWRPWLTPLIEHVAAEIDRARSQLVAAPADGATSATKASAPPPAIAAIARDIGDAPGAAAGSPLAQQPAQQGSNTAAIEAGDQALDASEARTDAAPDASDETAVAPPASAPLPPPQADPDDPHQVRALAAGLHPNLSRALLTRLTQDDYRNARAAIAKALAEVGDDDRLEYPQQRAPERALFTVHFVPGAAADCRRYVVSVTKDRWTTTALPMERCGVKAPPPPLNSAARS